MVVMLSVAAAVSATLATAWLALLRAGAQALIWIGAGGSCTLALANGIWLLVQVCTVRMAMCACYDDTGWPVTRPVPLSDALKTMGKG